jgi:ribosome biogenesis GTPase A
MINWYPGHMKKTFDLMQTKIKEVDLVVELLDARIPFSSSNPKINELFQNKQRVKLVTKVDQVDDLGKLSQRMEHFYPGEKYLTVNLFEKKNKQKIEKFIWQQMNDYIENKKRKGMKVTKLKMMIVGVPNVGKSTLINLLSGKNVANVGDRPGVTRSEQWLNLSNKFLLLDMPGVLWPKFDDPVVGINLALTNAIKRDILPMQQVCEYMYDNYLVDNAKFKYNDLVDYVESFDNDDLAYDTLMTEFAAGKYGKLILD